MRFFYEKCVAKSYFGSFYEVTVNTVYSTGKVLLNKKLSMINIVFGFDKSIL